jgi:hypothetical protein
VVEQRLSLPADRELARHASDAIAPHSRRGWRIDKPNPHANIDAGHHVIPRNEGGADNPAISPPSALAVMPG